MLGGPAAAPGLRVGLWVHIQPLCEPEIASQDVSVSNIYRILR